MGNSNSTPDQVVMSRATYLERMKEFNDVVSAFAKQKTEISDLESQIKELQLHNTKTYQEKQQLQIELQKYESLPIIKLILKINDQINEIDDKIVKISNTKQVDRNEIIRQEINELNRNIANRTRNLPNNIANRLLDNKASDISQLQEAIINDELIEKTKPSVCELLQKPREKLEKIKQNFILALAKDAAKVDKELSTIEQDISTMRVSAVNPNYEKLKAILIEQENQILRLQLAIPNPNVKKLGKSDDSLLFCNIPEESTDFRSDYDKVREILRLFPGVSDYNIHIVRVGKRTPRSLRVEFPNIEDVEKIVRYRHKLNSTPFSHVRIYGSKNENRTA